MFSESSRIRNEVLDIHTLKLISRHLKKTPSNSFQVHGFELLVEIPISVGLNFIKLPTMTTEIFKMKNTRTKHTQSKSA